MWNAQTEALKSNYRVIAYDVRGHGNSDLGTEECSIELFASDLIGLINELSLSKVTICGQSMGGYIALNAINSNPDLFEAIVLCDTQCVDDTIEMKEKRMTTIENIKEHGAERYANDNIVNLFAPESFNTNQSEIAQVREMILNTSTETLCNTIQALSNRKETCSKLHKIKVPTLVLVGKEDRITPPAASRLMTAKIEGSIMFTIVHAGHMANMENQMEFNSQLNTFMQRSVCSKQSSIAFQE